MFPKFYEYLLKVSNVNYKSSMALVVPSVYQTGNLSADVLILAHSFKNCFLSSYFHETGILQTHWSKSSNRFSVGFKYGTGNMGT